MSKEDEYFNPKHSTNPSCQSCNRPLTDAGKYIVPNPQRHTSIGAPRWVAKGVPLRWIPQNKLLTATICVVCLIEYVDELQAGEF